MNPRYPNPFTMAHAKYLSPPMPKATVAWEESLIDTPDDPHTVLKASVMVNEELMLHLIAFEVTYDEKGGQVATYALWQEDLEFLQSQQEGQVQTFWYRLKGDTESTPPLPREWTVLAYPYSQ